METSGCLLLVLLDWVSAEEEVVLAITSSDGDDDDLFTVAAQLFFPICINLDVDEILRGYPHLITEESFVFVKAVVADFAGWINDDENGRR